MSFPHISQNSDSFHNLTSLACNEDLLYLLSLRYTDGLSERSIYKSIYQPDDIKGLDAYDVVDFQRDTYLKLRYQSIYHLEDIDDQSKTLVKGIYNSGNEYYFRTSVCLAKIAEHKWQQPIVMMQGTEYPLQIQEFHPIPQHLFIQCQSILVSPSMHSNPARWPWQFDEFLHSLQKLQIGGLFYEPEYIRQDILTNIDRLINSKDLKHEHQQTLMDTQFALGLREASMSQLLRSCLLSLQMNITPTRFTEDLARIPEPKGENYHYMRSLCDAGGFHISYFAHFVKLQYNSVAFAASKEYLYIFVSSANGVMLKVGTGEGGTQPGQVYLKKRVKRQEEVAWVYIQGKLYLRSHGREAGTIEVISTETFETQETITLHCPEIFQHPTLQVINKNYPIMTDGHRFYIVGRRLNVQKTEDESPQIQHTEEELKAQIDQQVRKREEKLKKKKEQTPKPEVNDDHTVKLMEYVLYEFDMSKTDRNQTEEDDDETSPEFLEEMYNSFQGYFTMKECLHALSIESIIILDLHKNDIQTAVQWLTDEGEKERTKTSVACTRKTLLAQAEITSDISAKQLKNNAEVVCKETSLLHPHQVSGNVWTMNGKYVTVYTETGVKVFAKDPSQVKEIFEERKPTNQHELWSEKGTPEISAMLRGFETLFTKKETTQGAVEEKKRVALKGTYLSMIDGTSKLYYLQPGYTVTYEPQSKRYYVLNFQWNQQTNVFPCLVSICNDLDLYQEMEVHKNIAKGTDFATQLTSRLLQLQSGRFEYPWKLNDWEFAYAFVIKEIEQRIMNSSNEDEKKKFRADKTKFINKLNKVIEYQRSKRTTPLKTALREIRKCYMFCLNGDLAEVQAITKLLLLPNITADLRHNLLSLLQLWGLHSDQTIAYSVEGHKILKQLGDLLYELVKQGQPLALQIVVSSHRLFLRTNEQQVAWLELFVTDSASVKLFCAQYLEDMSSINKHFYLKDSKIEYEPKVEKALTPQSEVMNLYPKFYVHADQAGFIEAWTRLLLRDITDFAKPENSKNHFFNAFYIDETQEDKPLTPEQLEHHQQLSDRVWASFAKLAKLRVPQVYQFLNQIISDTWCELSKIACGNTEWNLKTQLSKRVLLLLEDVLADLKSHEELTEVVLQWLAQWFKLLFPSSVTLQPQDCDMARSLVNIFSLMKEHIHGLAVLPRTPGVDQTTERVFETSHPYERGKPQIFEETHFPDAIAIVVDFDPRSSSDPSHDFLSINSWYSSQGAQPGVTQQLRDPVGISYRVSGKPNVRRPILLLGNTIQAEFHPSGQVRNEHSLNRWGFKIQVRPLYGLQKSQLRKTLKEGETATIMKRFKSIDNVVLWVNTMRVLSSVIIENVLSLIGMEELRTPVEQSNSALLKWTLLKNGLVNFNMEDHLIKQPSNGNLTLVNKLEFSQSSYLKSVNGGAFTSKNAKEQSKYWQLKRDLFRLTYKQTHNNVADMVDSYAALEEKDDFLQVLWDEVLKTNPIVSEQVKQVREHKGDFYHFAVTLAKQFTDSFRYKQEKQRPTFKPAKAAWEQVEALIVLVVLYHSGLMIIQIPNIEEYLQGNLSTLSDARNDCVNHMINTVQTEKEWQQNVETLDQCWEELLEKRKSEEAERQKTQSVKNDEPSPAPTKSVDGHFVKQGNQLRYVSKKKPLLKKKPTTKPALQPKKPSGSDDESDQVKVQEKRKRYIDSDISDQLYKNFQLRLEGNVDMVKQLCKLRNVQFNAEDPTESMKQLFSDLIENLGDKESQAYKYMMQSPYVRQAHYTIKKALLLLLINNSRLEERLPQLGSDNSIDSGSINGEKKIKPPGMLGRSQSHQLDEKQVDRQKLLKFRLWLDSYQKWKQLHSVQVDDELSSESPDIQPIKSVVNFLKSDVVADLQLLEIMKNHDRRCVRRIVGLQILNEFSTVGAGFVPSGLLCTGDLLNHKVELCNSKAKQLLLSEVVKRLIHLIGNFNQLTQQARSLNLVLGQHHTDSMDSFLLEQMKQFHVNVSEINQLLSVNNNQLWSHPDFSNQLLQTPLFKQFLENAIQIALLNSIFVTMSQSYQTLALMSHHILYAIKHTLFLITDNGVLKHIQQLLDTLVHTLYKELGVSGSKIKVRLLAKLHDSVGASRVNLILQHILDTITVHRKAVEQEFLSGVEDLVTMLFLIIYHSTTPTTIKLASRTLKALFAYRRFDTERLESPLAKQYIWETLNLDRVTERLQAAGTPANVYELTKKLNLQLETKELEFEKPASQLLANPQHPVLLLIQKLGRMIAIEQEHTSIEAAIQRELAICQSKNRPQRSSKKQQPPISDDRKYKVLVQVSDDEEISHLVRVLYYWEELYPAITPRLARTIEEYHELREREKKRDDHKIESKDAVLQGGAPPAENKQAQQAKALQQYKVLERILLTHPDVAVLDSDELNLGWGFNFTNMYGDMKVLPAENRKQGTSMRKSVKKNWNLPNAEELDRKYEELLKTNPDTKLLQTQSEIETFLAQRNFLRRMYQHTQEVMYLSRQLQVYGYCALSETYTFQKAQELAQLIRLSIEGKLEAVPIAQFDAEFQKKVDPNPYFMVGTLTNKEQPAPKKKPQEKQPSKEAPAGPKGTSGKSNMVVCIMETNQFTAYEFRMDYITLLPQQAAMGQVQTQMTVGFFHEANRSESFGHHCPNGAVLSQVSAQLISLLGNIAQVDQKTEVAVKDAFEKALVKDNKQETNKFDELFVVGLSSMFSGWAQQIAPGLPSFIKQFKHEEERLYIIEGGAQSGQKQCVLISDQDDKLNFQSVKLEEVQLHPQVNFEVSRFLSKNHYKQLLSTIILINQNLSKLDEKQSPFAKNQFIILRNLLNICGRLDWFSFMEHCASEQGEERAIFAQLLKVLLTQASGCLFDQSEQEYEYDFCQKWERMADLFTPTSNLLSYPVSQDLPHLKKFLSAQAAVKVSADQCITEPFKETVQSVILTPSCYVRSLPEPVVPQNEHKMLMYWENYIIPKMQDYVRGSLKPWELLDFFEQIRQPLRKGDQTKALEISYIICDQRLPNGVVVPDANHDWSTLNIEEIVMGQLVIARLTDKGSDQIYSKVLSLQRKQGVAYICGQVIGVEMRSGSVLILHNDVNKAQLVSTWFPASALKQVQIYSPPPANSYPPQEVTGEFLNSLKLQNSLKSLALLMQMTHGKAQMKAYEVIRALDVKLLDIIEFAIKEELQGACIDAWLQQQGNHVTLPSIKNKQQQLFQHSAKEKMDFYLQEVQARINQSHSKKSHKLRDIQHYMDHIGVDQIAQIMDWLDGQFQGIKTFLATNLKCMDLTKTQVKGQPVQLNSLENQISGLCIVFKNDSLLCLCSGLRFYSDPLGINNFKTLAAGKESRHKLPPLVFDRKQVYCEYFFNADAVPPFQQTQVQSLLQCIVYPIPSSWNTCCWVADALATSLVRNTASSESLLPFLQRLNTMLQNLAVDISGPHLLVQQLYKLIFRTTRKIRSFVMLKNITGNHFELIGLKKAFIQECIEKASVLQQQQAAELSGIYSAYIQDLVEMIAVALSPLGKQLVSEVSPPSWISSYVRLLTLLDFIKGDRDLTEDLNAELQSMLRIDGQWDNLIVLRNMPKEFTREVLCELIEKQKGRVLNPAIDVTVDEDGTCVILLDGWASLDLEEQSQDIKRMEQEKEKEAAQNQQQKEEEEVQEPEEDRHWNCEMCTLENRWEAPACEICGAQAPANKGVQVVEQQEPEHKVDMSEQEKQMQQKDQDRFNALVEVLQRSVEQYYETKREAHQGEIKKVQAQIETLKLTLPAKLKPSADLPKEKVEHSTQKTTERPQTSKSKRPPLKNQKKNATKESTPQPQQQQPEKPAEQTQPQPPAKDEKAIQSELDGLEATLAQLNEIQHPNISSVSVGKTIFEEVPQILQKFFQLRLQVGQQAEGNKVSQSTIKILKELFKSIQADPNLKSAAEEAAKRLLQASIASESELIAAVEQTIQSNSLNVFRFFEYLGYDLWLNQTSLYRKQSITDILKVGGQRESSGQDSAAYSRHEYILNQLKKFIEIDVCKETKAVLSYKPTNIRFPDYGNVLGAVEIPSINYGEYVTSLLKYTDLVKSPQHLVRVSWGLLKLMNQSLDEAGQFINMEIPNDQPTNQFQKNVLLLQTAAEVCVLRDFYMSPIKIDLVQKVLSKTALPRDGAPKISVERLKLARETEQQKRTPHEIVTAKQKDDYLFTKAYEQMKEIPPTFLRPIKPTGTDPFLAFELNFKGEDVQGESGPYRQFFADISKELEPQSNLDRSLNLLHPSVNNVARLGNAKDKFVIHPSAKSTYQLQLYEFLGTLMGCSVRTATHFTLDLPSLFWKQLVGESIKVEDIEEVDTTLFTLIQFLEDCNQEEFETSITENWVTLKSDRTVTELRKNGSKQQVQYAERMEYIEKLLQVKMTESDQQTNAIKRGLSTILPTPLLNLITASDLELWVCGRAKVDVDLLRRHTRYAGELNEQSPRVKFLWEALSELTEQEKLRFVKFCWGQERQDFHKHIIRLPANDEEFERNQIRFMIKPATFAASQPDKALPKADTCFFNIELPKYSSKEILKKRVLTAINFDCDSMNAEQRVQLDPNARHHRGGGDSDIEIEGSGNEEEQEE